MPRTVSIRTTLLRNLIAIVAIMGLAILATTYLGSRRAIRNLSDSIVQRTLDTVGVRLEAFFAAPERQLRVTRAQLEAGLFDLTPAEQEATADPDRRGAMLRDRRNRILAPLITEYTQVSSLMVADTRGREHMLLHAGDRWRCRVTRRDEWDDEVRWIEWTDETEPAVERRERLDYDPRPRPWFRGAIDASVDDGGVASAHWTEPYVFFTTKDPGITVSMRAEGDDGVRRVIGFDVLLNDISVFTRGLTVGRRGIVAVLTADRRLIGLPNDPRFDDPAARSAAYLKPPTEIGLTLVTDAATAFRAEQGAGTGTVRFVSGGEPWWARVGEFRLSDERHLRIAIVVPEADLVGNLAMQRAVILAIVASVLVVGLWRVARLARRIGAPVEALAAQSDRIRQGDFEPGPSIESRLTEVNRLAEAQDDMRVGLEALVRLEKVERDLDIARDIQRGLLPEHPPDLPGFEIAGWNQAADETGGDYFDWLTLPDGRTVITLADVTGHGIGPALIVAVCRAYMRASTGFGATQLSDAVGHVNDLMYEDTAPEHFVTAAIGMIEPGTHRLTLVSAGHGPNLFYEARTGTVHQWDGDVPPLGVIDEVEFPEPRVVEFQPGDMLVLTTDGFFEWASPTGELYGTQRLRDFVAEHHDLEPETLIRTLYESVLAHASGTVQADDLTALVIRRPRE